MDAIHRNTVGDALRRAARVHRGAAALTFQDRTWSFQDLDAAANHLASGQRFSVLRKLRHLASVSRRIRVRDVVARGSERSLSRIQRLHADQKRSVQSTHNAHIWQDQV